MAEVRGSSPTTAKALSKGGPVPSDGCQGMLRVLPVAALAMTQHQYFENSRPDPVHALEAAEEWARNLAMLTHDDGRRQSIVGFAIRVLAGCLACSDGSPNEVVRSALGSWDEPTGLNVEAMFSAPLKDTAALGRLAPDTSAVSALTGGLYAALSFPEEETVEQAIDFAAKAPDPDSVAAVAGAILGARYGYEAMPTRLLSRLEVGWALDRLAVDLSAELTQRQGGSGWKMEDWDMPVLDTWWSAKYPGS